MASERNVWRLGLGTVFNNSFVGNQFNLHSFSAAVGESYQAFAAVSFCLLSYGEEPNNFPARGGRRYSKVASVCLHFVVVVLTVLDCSGRPSVPDIVPFPLRDCSIFNGTTHPARG